MSNKIEVMLDHPEGPRVLCPVDDPGAVEDALPYGWTVGHWWTDSSIEDKQPDGRWLLKLICVAPNNDPGDEQPEPPPPQWGIPSLRGVMNAYLYAKALKEGLATIYGTKADFKLEYRNGEYVLVGEITLPVPVTRITYTEPGPRNY